MLSSEGRDVSAVEHGRGGRFLLGASFRVHMHVMTQPFKTLTGKRAFEFISRWPNFAPYEINGDKATVSLYAYSEEEKSRITQMVASLKAML